MPPLCSGGHLCLIIDTCMHLAVCVTPETTSPLCKTPRVVSLYIEHPPGTSAAVPALLFRALTTCSQIRVWREGAMGSAIRNIELANPIQYLRVLTVGDHSCRRVVDRAGLDSSHDAVQSNLHVGPACQQASATALGTVARGCR